MLGAAAELSLPGVADAAEPVRVMIVDDSVVVRGMVARWLAAAPGLAVVGSAADGEAAVQRLDLMRPDIVLLDLDMPKLDGLAVLPLLLARRPGLSIVVMSTLTQRNAQISLTCMARGAADYIPKPDTRRDLTLSTSYRDELLGKLAAIAAGHLARRELASRPAARSAAPRRCPAPAVALHAAERPQVLAIGASTGGPRAMIEMLRGLGAARSAMPILVVQHLPPLFTRAFADLIRNETGLPADEATDGEALVNGQVYVAPGGRHMGLGQSPSRGAVIRLDDGAPVAHCRPAVDILFGDAARLFGRSVVAVVLTGMGSDGTAGARAVAAAGGCVLVQDEATSTVWGMPGSVAGEGLARSMLSPAAIGQSVAALAEGRLP